MRLLCIAAQGEPYGHVTIAGRAPSLTDLAKLIRPRPKRSYLERLIAELEANGVASRGACGCLVSRRQEADGKLAGVRRSAAKTRWNKENDPDLHMQNDDFASLRAREDSQKPELEESPPTPRKRGARAGMVNGGGRKREPRNGFVTEAAEMIEDHQRESRVVPVQRVH